MNMKKYGLSPSIILNDKSGIPARITAVHRDLFEFVCEFGAGLARLKTASYRFESSVYPTAGDFVLLDWQKDGESRILETLPRKTSFSRLDPSSSGHAAQAVAANFDYVFIMQSLDSNFNPRRLERYLALAWQSGAIPAVILTKADTAEDYSPQLRAAEKLAMGVCVVAVSAKTGFGLDQLSEFLKPGKTIVFLGSSGVGKSSLINALAGEELMKTAEIRKKDGRGRHTTSHRQLLLLKAGFMVIDTPGMRELGICDAKDGVEKGFSDILQYSDSCKFNDCSHQNEPGCAIKDAIKRGEISRERWESYQKLSAEDQFSGDKAEYLRKKQKLQKSISKSIKQMKSIDYRIAPCEESFSCKVCGAAVSPEEAGSRHRNHCPHCLSSIHADNTPGDRASLCRGIMDPIGVWVRKNGEWAIIHRCRSCGELHSNRVAADDNHVLLMSIAVKPLAAPPFPLEAQQIEAQQS